MTICSSVNRVFFMAPSLAEGAILSGFSWSENRQAGHSLIARYLIDPLSEIRVLVPSPELPLPLIERLLSIGKRVMSVPRC